MRKALFAAGLVLVCAATAAIGFGFERRLQLVANEAWLASDECSPSLGFSIPHRGIAVSAGDQCALEQHMKEQLRKGPIDLGPAPELPDLKI